MRGYLLLTYFLRISFKEKATKKKDPYYQQGILSLLPKKEDKFLGFFVIHAYQGSFTLHGMSSTG